MQLLVIQFTIEVFHVGQCVPVWTASFSERLKICVIGLRKTSLLELQGVRTLYISWHSKQNTTCRCGHWSPPPVIDQLLLHSAVSFDHAWQHDACDTCHDTCIWFSGQYAQPLSVMQSLRSQNLRHYIAVEGDRIIPCLTWMYDLVQNTDHGRFAHFTVAV